MAFDSQVLMNYTIPEARQELRPADCILYALSIGVGADPLDPQQLPYIYERGLKVLPMMTNVLATPGFWMRAPETRIDWQRALHVGQVFTIHSALPTKGTLVGRTRVTGILDKGPDKGAIVFARRDVFDADSGELLCTLDQTSLCRGDGGCGSVGHEPDGPHPVPGGDSDRVCDLTIPVHAGVLYRLNGDLNPLHVDPEVARQAGFDRPILHGLCTFGYAGHAVLRACCDYEGARVRGMGVHFKAPMFPGETLRTELWQGDGRISFRAWVLERDVVVLDNGYVEMVH